MPDSIFYKDEMYAVLRVSQYNGLFDPRQFGITREKLHTGARRGFVCCYSVVDETLLLSSLEIRAKDGIYPAINDAIPFFPDIELDEADHDLLLRRIGVRCGKGKRSTRPFASGWFGIQTCTG